VLSDLPQDLLAAVQAVAAVGPISRAAISSPSARPGSSPRR
jgi:hypothetical protein